MTSRIVPATFEEMLSMTIGDRREWSGLTEVEVLRCRYYMKITNRVRRADGDPRRLGLYLPLGAHLSSDPSNHIAECYAAPENERPDPDADFDAIARLRPGSDPIRWALAGVGKSEIKRLRNCAGWCNRVRRGQDWRLSVTMNDSRTAMVCRVVQKERIE